MGRWRAPGPASSPYITAEGHRRLQDELKQLWIDRREVVAAITAAAAEGDRSENAEYIYRKKQLRGMDRRIRYLQKRLDVVEVVRQTSPQRDRVFFGAVVTLEDASGECSRYRIVGADEIDSKLGWISVDSPVARALLGRRLDEEIRIDTPAGSRHLTIVAIDYP
jgi:transcription elongation factor GreB